MPRLQAGMWTLLPGVRSRKETGKCEPTLSRNLRAEETNARHDIRSGEIFTRHRTLPTLKLKKEKKSQQRTTQLNLLTFDNSP